MVRERAVLALAISKNYLSPEAHPRRKCKSPQIGGPSYLKRDRSFLLIRGAQMDKEGFPLKLAQ